MNICFFSHGSATNQDGASLSMLNIMEELTHRGHNVIGVMSHDVNLEKWKKNEKIKFEFLPTYDMRLDLDRTGLTTNLKYSIKNLINQHKAKEIYNKIKDYNIDIIHINGINNGIGAKIAIRLNIPYVWHIRQLLQEDLHQRLFNKKQVWPMMENSSEIIAISEVVKSKFSKEIKKPIKVIYNGVPLQDYLVEDHPELFSQDKVRILLPGRIVEGKGQMDALKALKILKDQGYDNIELIIVGNKQSNYYYELEEFIKNNDLQDIVVFHSYISDLRESRRQCDIGLTTSVKEAFGRVTIENQLGKMLVIGSNTGGTPELIDDGKTGFLYEQGNPEDLAKKIKYAIDNPSSSNDIANYGYKVARKKFSISNVVDTLLMDYQNILDDWNKE